MARREATPQREPSSRALSLFCKSLSESLSLSISLSISVSVCLCVCVWFEHISLTRGRLFQVPYYGSLSCPSPIRSVHILDAVSTVRTGSCCVRLRSSERCGVLGSICAVTHFTILTHAYVSHMKTTHTYTTHIYTTHIYTHKHTQHTYTQHTYTLTNTHKHTPFDVVLASKTHA